MSLNQKLYDNLHEVGFLLKFKPTLLDVDGKIKGNVDADLVLQAMIDWHNFDKAIIVSSDDDFYPSLRIYTKTQARNRLES